jgi:hypothetical protein
VDGYGGREGALLLNAARRCYFEKYWVIRETLLEADEWLYDSTRYVCLTCSSQQVAFFLNQHQQLVKTR